MSYLDSNTFTTVVKSTPLISIDLIIRNSHNEILLGRRLNAPARGLWFTPGGRIYKNEKMSEAFTRIIYEETSLKHIISDAQFIGAFEHFYDDSAISSEITTHYVVLAYEIHSDVDLYDLPDLQHSEYHWLSVPDLMNDETVHTHVKCYFTTPSKSIK